MVSPAASEDFEPRAQDDPRDKAVIWLSDLWHDQHPREWVAPECRTICSTTQGALNAVAQLTEFVQPAEHRGLVRKYVYNRLGLHSPQAYTCEHPKVEMAKAIRAWACALNQTFLIATDKGGGHIAETWRACGPTGQGQVSRREAQQIFREHGLLLVIDLVQLRTVALMIHPDKKARFEGDLLKWTVHEHLGPPPPVVTRPPTPHPATDMDARVRAALESAGRAIAATKDAGNRVLILNFEKQGVMQMADAIYKHTNA
jgi:hypothetical protein